MLSDKQEIMTLV